MKRRDHVTALACGLAGEVIRNFGEVRLRVFGTSMVPTILPGDFVSIQKAAISEISTGEIALYQRDGRLFVHRVVARESGNENVITRGDRLSYNDPPVTSRELLGRVIFVERGASRKNPARQLTLGEHFIARLLRISDRGTYLYARLATRQFGRKSNAFDGNVGRAECQV